MVGTHLNNNLEKQSLKIEFIQIINNLIKPALQIKFILITIIDRQLLKIILNQAALSHLQHLKCKDNSIKITTVLLQKTYIQIAIQLLIKTHLLNKKIESHSLFKITY
jgi:uncharacterized membrane protein YvlD (DUF360 family)